MCETYDAGFRKHVAPSEKILHMFELQSFGQKKFWGRIVDEQILEIGSNRVVAEAGRIISNKISSRQDLQSIEEMAPTVDGQSETIIREDIQEGGRKKASWELNGQ